MFVRQIIELLTPVACLSCSREGDYLCQSCLHELPVRVSACYRCNRLSVDHRTCANCSRHTKLSAMTVGAYYDGAVKDLVLKLKFDRSASAAATAAKLILRDLPADFDMVTAVPVSPARRRERGYNQAELIARAVARQAGKPYQETLMRASADHQLGRGRSDRFAQIKNVFAPLRLLAGERVVVIDDVLTTGATLEECAVVLRASGAKRVSGAVVARHRA
jgi:ComF family protein